MNQTVLHPVHVASDDALLRPSDRLAARVRNPGAAIVERFLDSRSGPSALPLSCGSRK